MLKKIVTLSISFILLLSFNINVFAQSNTSIKKIFLIDENGQKQELSVNEYNSLLEGFEKDIEITKTKETREPIDVRYNHKYFERYSTIVEGKGVVGNYQYNNSSSISNKTVTVSHTSTYSINLSGSSQIEAVQMGASFEFSYSKTYSESDTITLKPGEYGWVEIVPLYNKSTGTLKRYLGNTYVDSKNVIYKVPCSYLTIINTSTTKPF